MRRFLALLALLLVPAALPAQSPTVLYLVRHAEKVDNSANPDLSEAGKARATELVRVLGDAGVSRVFSTDYTRTRETARPVAEASGVPVELYDPRALPAAAAMLKGIAGRVLVVGHSNTTPALVQALGGDPGPAIDESEYDRLYILTVVPGQPVVTVRLRYGDAGGR